jgi:hypothetical protein
MPGRRLHLARPGPACYRTYSLGDCAQVAELVDALVSGTSGRKAVGVRVPSWADRCGAAAAAVAGRRGAGPNEPRGMKTDTTPCTCGHIKSQHNPAGRCLVQATSQPTGRGQRQQKICDCRRFRALMPVEN